MHSHNKAKARTSSPTSRPTQWHVNCCLYSLHDFLFFKITKHMTFPYTLSTPQAQIYLTQNFTIGHDNEAIKDTKMGKERGIRSPHTTSLINLSFNNWLKMAAYTHIISLH